MTVIIELDFRSEHLFRTRSIAINLLTSPDFIPTHGVHPNYAAFSLPNMERYRSYPMHFTRWGRDEQCAVLHATI